MSDLTGHAVASSLTPSASPTPRPCSFTTSPPPKMLFHSLPAPKMLFHSLPAPQQTLLHSLHPERAREKRAAFCASQWLSKSATNLLRAVGGLHSRTTLSSCRSPGRTPPNVGARTPCPKAKARAGSNTRHGSPHSTCTPLTSLLTNARQGRQR